MHFLLPNQHHWSTVFVNHSGFICCRYFIFTSFWAYKIYYVYGFMLLVFLILIVVTVCVTIVCTYFLLNAEDYRWFVHILLFCLSDWLHAIGHIMKSFYCVHTVSHKDAHTDFSQRVSIACYAEGYISHSKSVRLSVCLTVRLSHAGTESKRHKLRSWGLHCRIAPWLVSSTLDFTAKFQTEHGERGRQMREG